MFITFGLENDSLDGLRRSGIHEVRKQWRHPHYCDVRMITMATLAAVAVSAGKR